MARREAAIAAFLDAAGWGHAARMPLAGDAGLRRYERLTGPRGTAILMDADPALGEDVGPFLRVGERLRALGLRPPDVLASEPAHGLLLLEDFGDALLASVLRDAPDREDALYGLAADVLARIDMAGGPRGLPDYGPGTMADAAAQAWRWYAGRDGPAPWHDALAARLAEVAGPPVAMALRDFHAENLVVLADGDLGLLDFQDAAAAPAGYDLISLVQDARRDVAEGAAAGAVARFAEVTGRRPDALEAALAVMGAQRAIRILMVFARLSLHFGRPRYVRLIPRVWGQLQANLAHPAAAPLAPLLDLPEPDAALLAGLEDRCGTVPTL
ncbi:MAG: aminoglycoside phosphotransferase family protein [Hasllibacter sp.]